MLLFLLGGLAFAAVSVSLIARGARLGPARADMLTLIGSYGVLASDQVAPSAVGTTSSPVGKLASALGATLDGRLPWFSEARARHVLLAAGMYTTEPHRFMGYQILAGLGLPILWVLGSPAPAAIVAAGAVGIAAAGFWAPMLVVSRRGRSRLELVEYELPELVDLLVVTLEAGVSFAGSMQLAADRVQGPLGEELRLALQEQRMGLSVTEALKHDATGRHAISTVVRSLDSAGRAAGCLDRPDHAQPRRRDAQAPACGGRGTRSEGPVKLLFPLIFLMFPAMFVILLGPAAFRFAESFPG